MLLAGGKVLSYSSEPIVAFRIGWVVRWGSKTRVQQGGLISLREAIQPGFSANVPAQHVSPERGLHPPQSIGFFVSEVHYSNGNVWRLDKKAILDSSN